MRIGEYTKILAVAGHRQRHLGGGGHQCFHVWNLCRRAAVSRPWQLRDAELARRDAVPNEHFAVSSRPITSAVIDIESQPAFSGQRRMRAA
jgi:hypothetical protein